MKNKVIGNVNLLDLRNATLESVADIRRVENANLVIYGDDNASVLAELEISNANVMFDLPKSTNVQRTIGQLRLNRDFFKEQIDPLYLIVMGQLIVEPGIPPEDINRCLNGSLVMGQLICPEPVVGLIQSLNHQILGQTVTYPEFKRVEFGDLSLTDSYLKALDEGAELAVIGDFKAKDVLSDELLDRIIQKLFVTGTVTCHEANVQTIQNKLAAKVDKITIIPNGYKLVDKFLVLDETTLGALPVKKLYCKKRVEIDAEVGPDLLDGALESIIAEGLILCPTALKGVFTRKCDLLENRVVFYDGKLITVENDQTLNAARLEHMEGEFTLLVTGELTIDPQLPIETLAEKLVKVHNRGLILCTSEQMGLIESRLGVKVGEFKDSTQPDVIGDDKGYWVDNANYLAL